MSELEPTRTYSNPTANDILRRMLDERGVEWGDDGYPTTCTVWASGGIVWHGLWRDDCIELIAHLTPAQAIAATLGATDANPTQAESSGTCHPISCSCSTNCTNSERTETCHPVISDNLTESEGTGDAWADCSECGHLLFVLTDLNSQVPNFCPNCGRRIEQ